MSELTEIIKFGPSNFVPPLMLRSTNKALGGDFELRPLKEHHVKSDFKAVTTNAGALSHIFAKEDSWPTGDLTIEENLHDLKRHYMEFCQNLAFAYTVLKGHIDDDGLQREVIGCVYINPATKSGFSAEVFLWTTSESSVGGLAEREEALLNVVKQWVSSDDWLPVVRGGQVAFPGRNQSWNEWEGLQSRDEPVPRIDVTAQSIVMYNAKASGLAK